MLELKLIHVSKKVPESLFYWPSLSEIMAWASWCMDAGVAVSFEVGGGENVPGIPGACATRNFTYLVRGQWINDLSHSFIWDVIIHPFCNLKAINSTAMDSESWMSIYISKIYV